MGFLFAAININMSEINFLKAGLSGESVAASLLLAFRPLYHLFQDFTRLGLYGP